MSDEKLHAFQLYYDRLPDEAKISNDRATAWLFWFHGWEASLTAERERADKLAEALKKYANKDNWRQRDVTSGDFGWFMLGNAGWDIADAALAAHKQARKGE